MTLYKGVCSLSLGGEHAEFALYFRNTTLLPPFVLNTWSASISTLFSFVAAAGTSYTALMPPQDKVDDNWVYTVDESSDRYTAVNRAFGGLPGGSSGALPLPREMSVMALLYPAIRTRAIGRVYLPRLCTDSTVTGVLSPTVALKIRQMVDAWLQYLTDNLCTPVIRSQRAHLDHPVASHVVSASFAITRTRRKSGKPLYE